MPENDSEIAPPVEDEGLENDSEIAPPVEGEEAESVPTLCLPEVPESDSEDKEEYEKTFENENSLESLPCLR